MLHGLPATSALRRPAVVAMLVLLARSATSLRVASTGLAPQRRLLVAGALKNRSGPQQRNAKADNTVLNENIKAPELRVLLDRGDQPDESLGIIPRAEALAKAKELGVDLVLIADKDPPVCKIVNYGKHKYARDKKKKESAKKAKNNEIKELKMSYKIGDADYHVRRRAAAKFIQSGLRVKIVVQFRGREQQHTNLGQDLIDRFVADLTASGTNVARSKTNKEGRDLVTLLSAK